jgi:hypothetical protein
VDAGDGITAMVRMRGPLTQEMHDAFAEVARLAFERTKEQGGTSMAAIQRIRGEALDE